MAATPDLLVLDQVSRHFPSAAGEAPIAVLRAVSLTVQPGETVGVVGPSGSGKSTLLNVIGTLDQPDSGRVQLEGQSLGNLNERDLAIVRNRKIGFVFQSHHLLPQCTVLENVLIPTLAVKGLGDAGALRERAVKLLRQVGLQARLAHRPSQLSGGECQRVAVVRALINQPRLLLADEPTGALDRASAENLGRLLVDLNESEGTALIVVTHARDLAARMHRVMELRDGQLQPLTA